MEPQNTSNDNIQNSESGISMIYPPPETKKIIDEAATLVAEYGTSVESQMQNDEKFSFIKKNDPYYMYYQSKITQVQSLLKQKIEQWKIEQSQNKNTELENNNKNELLGKKRNNDNNIEKETKELLQNALLNKIEKIKNDNSNFLKNYENIPMPKPDIFTVLQPNISGTELDIIKISAQFVAKNGQKFLSDLIKREKDNPQFDFMKPQHTLFGYFTFLVGCYAKILNNKNEILSKIITYATDTDEILRKTHQNFLYENKINKISRGKKFSQEDLLTEEEKSKLKQIDWYDFVVVETINFDSDFENEDIQNKNSEIFKSENLYSENQNIQNPNTINSEISTNEINNNNEINDTNNNNDEQEIIYINGKKIIKNYVREKKVLTLKTGDIENNNITCPLCKLSISSDKIEEHLKIELLDPRWKKIQEEINKNQEQTNLADTMDFLSYLEDFSKSRPDLFGDISDITLLEKTRKEEKNKNINQEVWDGVDEHMNRTTANILMFKTQNKRHIDQSKRYTKKNNID